MAKASTSTTKAAPLSLLAGSRQQDEAFARGLRFSIGAHAVIAIAAIILSLTLSKEPVKLVQSIRVDLVGLPDVKKSDLSKVTPNDMSDLNERLNDARKKAKDHSKKSKEEPAPPVPDDTMAIKKQKEKPREKNRKDSLKSAIERIKALAAIESETTKKQKTVVKGNQLSKGNALSGDVGNDVNEYVGRLAAKLRDNWNLPVWLSRQKLNAKIVIFLDRAGYVTNTVLAQSSGNKQFDDYCMKTIRMAMPFGAPPEDVLDGGLTLGFPL